MCWLLQGRRDYRFTERSRLRPKTHGWDQVQRGTRERGNEQDPAVTSHNPGWPVEHTALAGGSDNRCIRRRSAVPSKVCMRTPGRQEEHRGTKLQVPFEASPHGRFHSSQHWKTGSYQSWPPDRTAVLTGSSGKAWTLQVKPSSLHSPSRRTEPDQCITQTKRKYC